MPAPPASARIAKTSLTRVASTASLAAMPPHTPATTRSSLLRSNSGAVTRSARANDVDPPRAHARVDHVPAADPGCDNRVPPRILQSKHVHVADLRAGGHLRRSSVGHDDPELTDADLRIHVDFVLLGGLNRGQLDPQVPDSQPVGRSNGGHGQRRIDVVADAV